MSVSFHAVRRQPATGHSTAFHATAVHSVAPPAPVTASLPEHLSLLRDPGTIQRFARNETIFHEGDPARHILQILSGTVRLCRHTPDGRRHVAEFVMAGDLCGVFGGTAQSFTAEAVTGVGVMLHPRAQFDRMAECDPAFRAKVLSHLSTHLLSVQMHSFVLGCQNAKERLASFILRLAERTGATRSGRLELAMGRQDIADHLGLTVETICRAITALRNERVLDVPNTHQLVLRNVDALSDLAGAASLN
ncbi:MAG: cyclic nucleotide-binding domain-containing protein [Alphaproteobacteria bacterium]|nr:cyclic nucleotide-binding domain-containing protein [Alphaproteobacteria bacterium]MBL6937701.1 cyclic nucleotide-binding domain-containing protein [Alphaproteobacteria bacterium]MBL7099039.1 cyclic nucleotide-binding domain-containing protein [Alphaproteobacteria bacterium]